MRKLTFIFLSLFLFVSSSHGNAPAADEPKQRVLTGAKVCLTMCVENDASVITECLNSVKDLADCISICDTGSTDNTIELIEKFLHETAIPGKIYRRTGENLGVNQTLAIKAAQKTIEELGYPLSDSYLLVLDPDMRASCSSSFKKERLQKDCYLLLEKSSSFSFYQYAPRLLRASLSWKSGGIIRASCSCREAGPSAKLHSLTIEEQHDAYYQVDKLKHRIKRLLDALAKDPNNAHYLFELAQCYKWLKCFDDAIHQYTLRLDKEGDKEEAWFSKFMIGECYEEKKEWERALYWYLEAYQSNPSRTSSLKKIAAYYRLRGQNDLAHIFASYGLRIPLADDQILFDTLPYHDYQFEEEISIAAYYTRFKDEGFTAANTLLLKKNVPWNIKNQTCKNVLFYVQNLKNARFEPIILDLPLIQEGCDERYHPMNPSIRKTERGYELICRAVNYTQKDAKIFNTVDEAGIFRTRNFLLHYDLEFNLLSQKEIIENLPRERVDCWISTRLKGLDDCRIFEWNKERWFTCTTNDTNPTGNFQISLCKLGDKGRRGEMEVEKLVPLQGPDPDRCEKNWLPFIRDSELYLIYSYDPFIIYKPDVETGECATLLHYVPPHDFSRFRGSAAPIPFDEGYLIIVHEIFHLPDYERRYTHRFLYLDKNFSVKLASKPFTFRHLGIEYCCGMILDHSGSELIIPIGVEDREAYLCFVDKRAVRSLLEPLPEITFLDPPP